MSENKSKPEQKEYIMDGPSLSNEMLSMLGGMTSNNSTTNTTNTQYEASLNKLGQDLKHVLNNNNIDIVWEKGKLVTKKK
tara:strand:+ start:690 stop:929 length:240 start_codon:yes stop_codon:yes gene_type:complete